MPAARAVDRRCWTGASVGCARACRARRPTASHQPVAVTQAQRRRARRRTCEAAPGAGPPEMRQTRCLTPLEQQNRPEVALQCTKISHRDAAPGGVRARTQNVSAMIVLGIDPGTASTGYGVVQGAGSRLQRLAEGVIADAPGGRARAPPGRDPCPRRGAARRASPRCARDRGALLRRQRPHRVRGRPGARRRAPGRRPARRAVPLLHAPAGQGRGLRQRPGRTRTRSRGWWRGCSACRAAGARPRRRRARGRDLRPQPGAAGARPSSGAARDRPHLRRGRRPARRPRGRRLRRRRLPARGLGARRSRQVPAVGERRHRCTPTWSSATTRSPSTGSPPRRSASCS